MDEYESAKLRMQCLELAKQVAAASCSGFYTIVSDAEKYWMFVAATPKTGVAPAAPKNEDDIPF